MKVVKIKKTFRNGSLEHFLVFIDDDLSNDLIEDSVSIWCETELSGSNYGYKYEWSFVEDEETIKTVLKDDIERVSSEIKALGYKKSEMEKYLAKWKS